MKTWKHRCGIQVGASEPVAYRLVLFISATQTFLKFNAVTIANHQKNIVYRQTEMTQVILQPAPCYAVAMRQIIKHRHTWLSIIESIYQIQKRLLENKNHAYKEQTFQTSSYYSSESFIADNLIEPVAYWAQCDVDVDIRWHFDLHLRAQCQPTRW